MATDPSIPLQIRGFDMGRIMDEAQQAQLQRQEMQVRKQQLADKQAERAAYGQIFNGAGTVGDAASGRQQGIAALARVNPEDAMKVTQYFSSLDEASRKREEAKYKAAAPLLVRVKQLPYEQRSAFIQSAAPVLMANGWSPQELQSFDPTDHNVDALSAAAMTVNEVIDSQKIDWHPIGENGSFATDQLGNPTGSGNPFAPGASPQSPPPGQPSVGGGNPSGNNNPGALRVPGSMQFQSFSSPQAGAQAQEALLGRYMGRGINSVKSIVETYAPRKSKGGDNTDEQVNNYIKYASQQLGVNPLAPLPHDAVPRLAQAMREFETGHRSSGYARSGGSAGLVSSKAEFDRLPSGTHFIAPDGSERIKP